MAHSRLYFRPDREGVARFRALVSDASPPGETHPLWELLDREPAVDPEAVGWIAFGRRRDLVRTRVFLAHTASALASLSSLVALAPPALEYGYGLRGPAALGPSLRRLAQEPADDADILCGLLPYAEYTAGLYGLDQFPMWCYGHPLYLAAAHGSLNAFLTAADRFWPLSQATLLFAFLVALYDASSILGPNDSRVADWLLERCDLAYAGLEVLGAAGSDSARRLGRLDGDAARRQWLAGRRDLTPQLARRILDERDRIGSKSDFDAVLKLDSAWALPTLEREARLDLRFVWIGLVVAARPGRSRPRPA